MIEYNKVSSPDKLLKNLSQNQLLNTNYNSDILVINQTISSSYHTDYKNSQISQLKELQPKSLQQVNSFINIQENSTGIETKVKNQSSNSPSSYSKIVPKKQSQTLSSFQKYEDLARNNRSTERGAQSQSCNNQLKQLSQEEKRQRGNSQVRFADEKLQSQDSNQMEFILSNIRESIDIMSSRVRQGPQLRDRNQDSVEREIQKLQNLQSRVKQAKQIQGSDHLQTKGSMNKFEEIKNLRDSWQSAINDNNLTQNLKADEAYCKIISSKSQENLDFTTQTALNLTEQKRGNSYSPKRRNENNSSLSFDNRQEISNSFIKRSQNSPQRFNSTNTIPSTVSPLHMKFRELQNKTSYTDNNKELPQSINDQNGINNSVKQGRACTSMKSQDQFSDLTFNDITKYLDEDSQIKLRSKIYKIQQRVSRTNEKSSHAKANSALSTCDRIQLSQMKQNEIIQKIVSTNQGLSSGASNSLLSIPEDVLNDIEEFGLDSMAILKTVLTQFQHLFSGTPTFPLLEKMKNDLNQEKSSRKSLQKCNKAHEAQKSSKNLRREGEQNKKSKADLRAEIEQQWLKNYEEANVFTLNKKTQKTSKN